MASWPALRAAVFAGGAWLAVYAFVSVTGQRFTTAYLTFGWQLAPYSELRAHPLTSTWNLHIQPPLWNLTIGLIGRWSPFTDALSLQLLMAGLGTIGAALLADALVCRGTRWPVAAGLAVAGMAIPDVFYNAFGATYELPVTTLLIAVVWIVCRGSRSEHCGRWLLALATVATATTMTRTVYHPLWLVLVLAVAAWWWRDRLDRRTVALAALVPLVAVGGWIVKNQVLVGRATLSTWTGMNLQRAVIPVLPLDDKERMIADGDLSLVAAAGPFAKFEDYEPAVGPCVARDGDPTMLTMLDRGEDVYVPNFNARCYLEVFDLAGQDAKKVIVEHPDVYVEGRVWAARTWFALYEQPSQSPSAPMRALYHLYDVALVGVPGTISMTDWGTPIYGPMSIVAHFSLLLVVCTAAVLIAAVVALRRTRRWRSSAQIDVVVGLIVAWTYATGILFELGEQARFRTMIDPLVLCFGLLAVQRIAGRAFSRLRGRADRR